MLGFFPSYLSDFIQIIKNQFLTGLIKAIGPYVNTFFLSEIIISRVQSRPWQSRTDVNKPTLQMFFPIPDQIRNCYKILLSAFKLDQNWYLRILAVKKSAENIVYAEKELFSPVFSTLFVNAFLITRFYFM